MLKGKDYRGRSKKMTRFVMKTILFSFALLIVPGISASFPNTAGHVVSGIHSTDRDAVKVMLACLKSTDPYVRLDAAQKLGDLGNAEAVDPLIGALKDENLYVRAYTAEALGKLRDSKAVPPLIAAMDDKEFFVRVHVIMAMGELGDRRAVHPLFALILDGPKTIKPYVTWALGELGDSGVVKSLCLKSLIVALSNGSGYKRVGDAYRKMIQQNPGKETDEAGLKSAGGFAGAIAVNSARITFEGKQSRTRGTVQVTGEIKAPLTVDDVLTMTFDGIELFSEPLSSFQLVSADRRTGGTAALVPAQYVYQEEHLHVRLCAVTGYVQVQAARLNLSELDTTDGVEVAVWLNAKTAVDNFDVGAGNSATLVFPIAQ
jgi:hypothetical protein